MRSYPSSRSPLVQLSIPSTHETPYPRLPFTPLLTTWSLRVSSFRFASAQSRERRVKSRESEGK